MEFQTPRPIFAPFWKAAKQLWRVLDPSQEKGAQREGSDTEPGQAGTRGACGAAQLVCEADALPLNQFLSLEVL